LRTPGGPLGTPARETWRETPSVIDSSDDELRLKSPPTASSSAQPIPQPPPMPTVPDSDAELDPQPARRRGTRVAAPTQRWTHPDPPRTRTRGASQAAPTGPPVGVTLQAPRKGKQTKSQVAPTLASSPNRFQLPDPPHEGGAGAAWTSLDHALDFLYGEDIEYITYEDALESCMAAMKHEGAPKTFADALKRLQAEADEWRKAAELEMQAHVDNSTWELVKLPPGRKPIGSRWVFVVKRKSDGSVDRYKGRLVARGFSRRPGIDFNEVFSPTARWAALRAILAQGALTGAHIESVDISNAYLNGILEDNIEVYMDQPEGFHQGERDWVCRLRKGLYGLKQSGRLWYERLGKVLEEIGFTRLKSDSSIYVWMHGDTKVVVPVFVDDLTIVSASKSAIQTVKDALARSFKLKDLGPTSFLLGVKVEHDAPNRSLSLSQRQYILDMLERFNMSDCKPVSTPMDPGSRLSTSMAPSTPEQIAEMQGVPYINAVGALNYLAIATRPDISYTVSKLARYNSNPGPEHWKAVKHLFRYLKGTLDVKLTYSPSDSKQPSRPMRMQTTGVTWTTGNRRLAGL
jgi:hypothetical protein